MMADTAALRPAAGPKIEEEKNKFRQKREAEKPIKDVH